MTCKKFGGLFSIFLSFQQLSQGINPVYLESKRNNWLKQDSSFPEVPLLQLPTSLEEGFVTFDLLEGNL